jgi:hypothetical protein
MAAPHWPSAPAHSTGRRPPAASAAFLARSEQIEANSATRRAPNDGRIGPAPSASAPALLPPTSGVVSPPRHSSARQAGLVRPVSMRSTGAAPPLRTLPADEHAAARTDAVRKGHKIMSAERSIAAGHRCRSPSCAICQRGRRAARHARFSREFSAVLPAPRAGTGDSSRARRLARSLIWPEPTRNSAHRRSSPNSPPGRTGGASL